MFIFSTAGVVEPYSMNEDAYKYSSTQLEYPGVTKALVKGTRSEY